MVVLAIVGALLVFKAKQRTDFDALMLMMLGANLPTVLLISPNNTHLNALTVPALYFAGMALAKLPRVNWRVAGLVVIVVLFGTYAYTYLGPAHTALAAGQNETPLELQTMLTKADDNGAPIYLATNHQQAGGMYTVALFNHPVKPANFKQEAVKSGGGEFIHYYRYGRYHISAQLPKSLPTHAVLIVRRGASLQSAKQAGYHLVKAGVGGPPPPGRQLRRPVPVLDRPLYLLAASEFVSLQGPVGDLRHRLCRVFRQADPPGQTQAQLLGAVHPDLGPTNRNLKLERLGAGRFDIHRLVDGRPLVPDEPPE